MTEETKPNRPTHTIYKVTGEGKEAKWVKVGAAFPHGDGQGMALVFDGIPVEGRIALRKNRDRKPGEQPAEATADSVPASA